MANMLAYLVMVKITIKSFVTVTTGTVKYDTSYISISKNSKSSESLYKRVKTPII